QEVKANKAECARLAYRASRMLLDLGRRMEGKWDNAPAALLENVQEFERTLVHIRDFMTTASEEKWIRRFLAKGNFQDAVNDFSTQLDTAAQAFQLASLIEIHYMVGRSLQPASISDETVPSIASICIPEPTPLVDRASGSPNKETNSEEGNMQVSIRGPPLTSDLNILVEDMSEVDEFIAQLEGEKDKHGVSEHLPMAFYSYSSHCQFRIYHQSDVRIGKTNRRGVGWFAGTGEARIHGQKVTIKRYDTDKHDVRQWVKDVKVLQQLFHANIPQMVGYSDGKTNVPFILLANGPTRDVGFYIQTILNKESFVGSIRAKTRLINRYKAAATHIQQQLSLSDANVQDYVESATYTIDSDNNVLMGIVPPKEGWVVFRSWNLCETLSDSAMKVCCSPPNCTLGIKSFQRIRQIRSLLQSLLPRRTDSRELCSELQDLLDDDSDNFTLTHLRCISLANGRHDHSWRERCPPDTVSVGDFGYMSDGGKDFANFKTLGNIYDSNEDSACSLDRTKEIEGTYVQWVGGFTERKAASPYLLQDDLEGWPVALMPQGKVTVFMQRQQRIESGNDAWKHFMVNAPAIARRHGVDPHALILITRTLTSNDFQISDWSPPQLSPRRPPNMPNTPRFHDSFNSPAMPTIVFLFTSGTNGFKSYITDKPMGEPRPQECGSTSWCYSCQVGWPVDYADYIQFDKEDFE
ncbi:hypothetical protein K488DRAFT_57492, partial [Vararia minispora EC-137]